MIKLDNLIQFKGGDSLVILKLLLIILSMTLLDWIAEKFIKKDVARRVVVMTIIFVILWVTHNL